MGRPNGVIFMATTVDDPRSGVGAKCVVRMGDGFGELGVDQEELLVLGASRFDPNQLLDLTWRSEF